MESPDFEQYRNDWPHIAEGVVWLQHAGITPPCRRVLAAATSAMEAFATNPDKAYRRMWIDANDGARNKVARFLGTDSSTIALVKNTSQGLIFVAEGFPWRAGDSVVSLAGEYPANRLPWHAAGARHGVEVRVVEPDPDGRIPVDKLATAIDSSTRLVSVSWVQFLNGFKIDLAALADLCRRRDAFLVVDGVQGVGALPLDLAGLDAVAVGGHKWLCASEGAGFLYLSPRLRDLLQPFNVSWKSVAEELSPPGHEVAGEDRLPELKAGAERFEEGTPNCYGNLMLGEAVTMLAELGAETIARRILRLQDYLIDLLAPSGFEVTSSLRDEERSAILCLRHPARDTAELMKALLAERIVAIQRGNSVRLAPHFYNNEADFERVAATLTAAVG